MEQLTARFGLWNLELSRDSVEFGGVSFHKLQGYEEAIRKVQRDHEAALTSVAQVEFEPGQPKDPQAALLQAKVRIRPYLLLFTLAQGVWVEWNSGNVFNREGKIRGVESRSIPSIRPYPSELIWLPNQEQYARHCMPTVSTPNFLDKTLFSIALSWFIQANEQEFEEANFLFLYTALEALSWGFVRQAYGADLARLKNFAASPRAKVEHFLAEKRAPVQAFFPNQRELFELRNQIVHRGMAYERSRGAIPFGKEILSLEGMLGWCFLTLLNYRGPYRDIRHGGSHRAFPEDITAQST